jgi:hypothetical protein
LIVLGIITATRKALAAGAAVGGTAVAGTAVAAGWTASVGTGAVVAGAPQALRIADREITTMTSNANFFIKFSLCKI